MINKSMKKIFGPLYLHFIDLSKIFGSNFKKNPIDIDGNEEDLFEMEVSIIKCRV